MKLVKIDREYDDLEVKEMSEVEIQGCILYLYKMIIEFEKATYGEIYTTLEDVENITYYCGKHLQIHGDYYLDKYYISSMFMIEKSKNTVFCICLGDEDYVNSIIFRINLR